MDSKKRNYSLYALAAAIAFIGALALGVPPGTLVLLAVIAACPLMMFFMMRGMHGGDRESSKHTDEDDSMRHDHPQYRSHRR